MSIDERKQAAPLPIDVDAKEPFSALAIAVVEESQKFKENVQIGISNAKAIEALSSVVADDRQLVAEVAGGLKDTMGLLKDTHEAFRDLLAIVKTQQQQIESINAGVERLERVIDFLMVQQGNGSIIRRRRWWQVVFDFSAVRRGFVLILVKIQQFVGYKK
jgi:hypothetical protein